MLKEISRYSAAIVTAGFTMRPVAFLILLFSCLSAMAGEAIFVDRDSLRYGDARTRDVTPKVLAARYLERSARAPAAQLLAAEQAGEFDSETAGPVYAEIGNYLKKAAYERAKFISDNRWRDWGLDRYNAFWLDRAEEMLQAGQLQAADKALRHLRKPWSDAHGVRRYSLWGRLYLRRGNYADAVIALDRQPTVAGDGLFDHYNFGIALLETGQRDRGLALIDQIGYLPLETEEHRVLRDQANLAMGWYWLTNDQGGTAREYFRRVRLEGPYSNMALLGLGWSELTADGEPQRATFKRRVLCEKPEIEPDAFMRLLNDRYAACRPGEKPGVFYVSHDFAFDTAERGAGRYLEALRPWGELSRRDVRDPAVQEALLAIGYAQEKRKSIADAERAYRLAVERYERESERLDELEAALRADTDPIAVIDKLAPGDFAGPRSRYPFVQALEARKVLEQAGEELSSADRRLQQPSNDAHPDRVAALNGRLQALEREVAVSHAALNRYLRSALLEDLATQRERLDQYHSRARLSLARLYDRRTEP